MWQPLRVTWLPHALRTLSPCAQRGMWGARQEFLGEPGALHALTAMHYGKTAPFWCLKPLGFVSFPPAMTILERSLEEPSSVCIEKESPLPRSLPSLRKPSGVLPRLRRVTCDFCPAPACPAALSACPGDGTSSWVPVLARRASPYAFKGVLGERSAELSWRLARAGSPGKRWWKEQCEETKTSTSGVSAIRLCLWTKASYGWLKFSHDK